MRIYLAGPITKGPMDHNIRQALAAADVLMKRGHHPFIPHLCFYWQLQTPRGYEEWMDYDRSWLLACSAILRLPGESSGADREMADAKQNSLVIFDSLEQFVQWDDAIEREHVAAFRGECNATVDDGDCFAATCSPNEKRSTTVRTGQRRVSADGSAWIDVLGCYGFGSLGALYSVTLVNSTVRSVSGMGEFEIAERYPVIRVKVEL